MDFFSLYKKAGTGIFFLFAISSLALHADNFTVFNTGVDASANLITPGGIDPHWSIVSGPDVTGTNAYAVSNVPSTWYAAPTGTTLTASWIAPAPDQSNGGAASNPFGTYDYQTTFDLTGFNPSTASITGMFSTDNNLTDLLINGNSTGITSTFDGFSATNLFTLSSDFQPGINTLDFILVNGDSPDDAAGPTGLIVDDLVGTASICDPGVPEPGTLSLILYALVTGAVLFRRKLA